MEKLNMHSPDFTAQNIAKLAELFPNCVTESKDDKGNLRNSIDFDLLRQELSADIVEGPKERYRLDWPGKRDALVTANRPIDKALRPCREESVNFDTTQNLFIEGDNLDALKLLQKTHLGKVKMIYIDPPYNTGNDFIYKDNFTEPIEEYHLESGQKDEVGNRLVANPESNGRFHSDWLSMMYPRLKLARNLLKDDGVIFISIDDGEIDNLRKLCSEIFGEENFVTEIAWRRSDNQANIGNIARVKEYIVSYCKNSFYFKYNKMPLTEKSKKEYRYEDKKGKFRRSILLDKTRGRHVFEIKTSSGNILSGPWMVRKEEFEKMEKNDEIYWTSGGQEQPYGKIYLHKSLGQIPNDFWGIEVGTNQRASLEVEKLFNKRYFDFPKPVSLLRTLISIGSSQNDTILDFFAGSATTAHAVIQLNAEDGGKRKFIMIQLPEKCDEKSEALKAGYENIAEISKERIRLAGKKIREENAGRTASLDIGFRALKIDTSNMVDVENTPDAIEQGQLSNFTENIKPERTPEDLLFQVLLNWGVDLTLPIATEAVEGLEVFFVDKDALVACFAPDGQITEDLCKELAMRKPLRVVFRDSGFENDSVKVNVEQIFKLLSPGTDVKTV